MKKFLLIFITTLTFISLISCSKFESSINDSVATKSDLKPYVYSFSAFDTMCAISIYGVSDELSQKKYMFAMTNFIDKFEKTFSKTIEGTDIYNINHREGDVVYVSPDTATLLDLGKSFYQWTNHKFDISSGTLIDLWDIKNRTTVPTLAEINEARSHCGNYNFTIEQVEDAEDGKTAKITFNGDKKTQYDLGAIVKGYCVDKLREMLAENSDIKACIVNLGGNVMVSGTLDGRKGGAFNVGIYTPFDNSQVSTVVNVVDRNVITSGDYERYFKVEGDDTIYHHIIDPSTGYPSNNGYDSVTIISENGLLGDFLSTSAMLLKRNESEELIKNCASYFGDKNVQAIYIDKNGVVSKYNEKAKLY